MRTLAIAAFLLGLLVPGCSWSAFDDLADQSWVDAVGAAEGVDPNDFVGIATPGMSGANAVFVVLGRATDSVGGYSYDADGSRSTVGIDIRGGATQFGPLAPSVVMAGDPYSNHVGVAGVTGAVNDGDTKVVHFGADNVATIVSMNDFNDPTGLGTLDGPIHATGMAYARTDDDDATASTTDVVLARGNQLAMVQNYAADAHTLIACLPDTSGLVMTVGAGQFDPADPDDEIILVTNDASGTAPQIVILDGSTVAAAWLANGQALGACFDGVGRNPIARISGPAGDAGFGTRMVVADFDGDGFVDFAISSPSNNRVIAYRNDGDLTDGVTGIEVNATLDASMFGASLATGELDGLPGDELVVGAPQSNIGGASNAGAVHVFVYDSGSGEFTRAMTVHDAQPEAEQRVGKSVAVVPWAAGGANVLVVGGVSEIFTYFRTQLYSDVRQ